MADIFISYARVDQDKARSIAEALEKKDWSVFWDVTIPVGKTWRQVIEEELQAARYVLVLWSSTSINKRWVLEEAEVGLERGNYVPALIEDVTSPLGFRQIQAAELTDWEGEQNHPGFQQLLQALMNILGNPPVEEKRAEREKKEEAERKAKEERKRREAEAKRIAEKEYQRQEAAAKREAEEKRTEKERRRKQEQERKRREEEQRKAEDEQKRKEAKADIKPDKPEPAKVRPPQPKPDATATIEPEYPKARKSSNGIKFGVVAGVIVLVMVGIWLYFSESQKKGLRTREEGQTEEEKIANDKTAEPDSPQKYITNGIDMEFVLISAGSFTMGSSSGIGFDDERPSHKINISRTFYLQKTEVTQGQWKKVMGDNPAHYKECGDDCPVESVSWEDAHEFIKKLNEMEGGDTYRLPTEAEWEYAVRAGTTTSFSFGDDEDKLADYAWFSINSDSKTHRVSTKKPNPWGLHDMHGNVWEWMEDDWHDNYNGAPDDGQGWLDEPRGAFRVFRGGCWRYDAEVCSSATRNYGWPDRYIIDQGFRLARTVPFDA